MAPDHNLVLYDYWRSSAAYRVRIALHLKGLAFEQRAVHLVRDGGEQHGEEYRRLNPQGLVPTLIHDGATLTQSLAICEYLDETFPGHALLPGDARQRAAIRSLAQVIACDVHPLNNLRVQQHLKKKFEISDAQSVEWMNHWMGLGFAAIEQRLGGAGHEGLCCFGDRPTLADVVLVPQVYNAQRFECDMSGFPAVTRIANHCRSLSAFKAASPENQPDAPRS